MTRTSVVRASVVRGGRRAAYAIALALVLAGAPARAEDPVEALLAGMASPRGVVARFHEVKTLALLDAPIESRGLLYFVPPDRLVRITQSPLRTALVVEGERIAFHDGSGEPADLSSEPTARQFVENFAVLFRADVEALRSRYDIRFQEEASHSDGEPGESDAFDWRMVLSPRSAMMQRVIARVVLRGDRRAIREIVIEEADGDRTVTTVTPLDVDRALSDSELRALMERPLDAAPLAGEPSATAPEATPPKQAP